MLLGLDLGTGSVKALLMDEDGELRGEGIASYAVSSPHPGWAESAPEEWWKAASQAVRRAVGERGGEIFALGLSGQMHGVVLSDGTGSVLRPAVLWADRRSDRELEQYRRLGEETLRSFANPLATGMAGPTLLWLRDHEPEVYGSAAYALQPKDWLRLRLTDEALSEPSDASATLLYDLERDSWSTATVRSLGLREDLLAPLVPSSAAAGILSKEAASCLRLSEGIQVAAGAADTAAAALGCGLLEPGPVQLNVGTGAQILSVCSSPTTGSDIQTHLYRTATESPQSRYYTMAAIQNAGLALEWVRKVLNVSWDELYAEAFSAPPGAGGAVFLPYLGGERTPHFDPGARGAWTGLDLSHERAHLLRAVLEGVAFSLREGLEALERTDIEAPQLRLAGGGTAESPWRQLLADVLGRPLLPFSPSVASKASARGAALLAGLASGVYEKRDIIALAPETGTAVVPRNTAPYEPAYARYTELYHRLRV
jgi:xylulokinase